MTRRKPIDWSWGSLLWVVSVLACVCAQPFTLGFYVDDWQVCASASRAGAPFSKALFQFVNSLDPTRPGFVPIRYLLSSVFRDRASVWQAGLLIANCMVALVIVWIIRELLGKPVSGVGISIGLTWLLLPWNAAAAFWLTFLPNVLLLAVFGLLCVLLLRSWFRQRHHAWWAGAIYLWICLCYEAFYFEWIALALIGLVMVRLGRARLKDVLLSSAGLVAAQACAVIVHLSMKPVPGLDKPVVSDWPRIFAGDLLTILPCMFRSAAPLGIPCVILGSILMAVWAFEAFRSRESAALGLSFLAGGVLSIFAFALGGRGVAALGVDTRTLAIFNFWFVVGAAVVTESALARSRPRATAAITAVLIALGGTLGIAHVLRSEDWAAAWTLQNEILAEAPLAELKNTPADSTIVFVNPLYVNGAAVFTEAWDLKAAMPWKYPELEGRTFLVYRPHSGTLAWDGGQLAFSGQPPLATHDIYLWQPARRSFARAAAAFTVHQDLIVDTNPSR
jgi:hypothetical protein